MSKRVLHGRSLVAFGCLLSALGCTGPEPPDQRVALPARAPTQAPTPTAAPAPIPAPESAPSNPPGSMPGATAGDPEACPWALESQSLDLLASESAPWPSCDDVYSAPLSPDAPDWLFCFSGTELTLWEPISPQEGRLRLRVEVGGRPHAFLRLDDPAALLTVGLGRGAADARARAMSFALRGDRICQGELLEPLQSDRQQISAIAVGQIGETQVLSLTAFRDRYHAAAVHRASDGSRWSEAPRRMALLGHWLNAPGGSWWTVSRVYGDGPEDDGDLMVRRGREGEMTRLPTLRGVRSAVAADLDRDGADELYFGDGWHRSYGRSSEYRLQVWRPGEEEPALLDQRAEGWSVMRLDALNLDGDPAWELLASTNGQVFLYDMDGAGRLRRVAEREGGALGEFAPLRLPGRAPLLVRPSGGPAPILVSELTPDRTAP